MPEVKYIAKRNFKYDGRVIRKGDEFTPTGGRWDEKILNPAHRFIEIVPVKMQAPNLGEGDHQCGKCGRRFTTPQGLSAHSRYCDK